MNIPDKLKIGGNTIKVKRDLLREVDSEHNGGWFTWEDNLMCIATDMPKDREATCFLHEILHAINTYMEEKDVTFLSEALIQVIRDNNLDFTKLAQKNMEG